MKTLTIHLLKTLVISAFIAGSLIGTGWAGKDEDTATSYVEISNVISRYFVAVDERNWEGAKSLMTNPFHLDYSSFGAGDPADLDPAEILKNWAAFLPGFDATHHQIGTVDIEVDGETAKAKLYGTATHIIDDRIWTVVGTYNQTLLKTSEGWKLSGTQFVFKYQSGDTNLPVEAQKRMKSN